MNIITLIELLNIQLQKHGDMEVKVNADRSDLISLSGTTHLERIHGNTTLVLRTTSET